MKRLRSLSEAQRRDFWQQAGEKFNEITGGSIFQFQRRAKPTGLLKMKVRVIDHDGHEEFLQQHPPPSTRTRHRGHEVWTPP